MKMQKGAWINFAALILVNLLWAAQYPAYKIAGNSMESATLNFWTLLFASVFLVPLWLREKQKRKTARKAFDWKTLREYLLLGVLGIVPPSVMLSWGIARSSASNAAILSLTIPVLMTGLGVLMLGEKLSLIRAFSLVLGLVGYLAGFDQRSLTGFVQPDPITGQLCHSDRRAGERVLQHLQQGPSLPLLRTGSPDLQLCGRRGRMRRYFRGI